MPKLSYTKYKTMSARQIEEKEFNRLIAAAEEVINIATMRHYQFNDFAGDFEWRKEAYLMAIAQQVDYFSEIGATSLEAINARPQSISLGRTSISYGSSQSLVKEGQATSLLCHGAENSLVGTGLLYRGVKTW